MKKLLITLVLIFSFASTITIAQERRAEKAVLIKAGRLIDVRAGRVLENQGILVVGERIKAVGPLAEVQKSAPANIQIVDLSRSTVLPGLADCHTLFFLETAIT